MKSGNRKAGAKRENPLSRRREWLRPGAVVRGPNSESENKLCDLGVLGLRSLVLRAGRLLTVYVYDYV